MVAALPVEARPVLRFSRVEGRRASPVDGLPPMRVTFTDGPPRLVGQPRTHRLDQNPGRASFL